MTSATSDFPPMDAFRTKAEYNYARRNPQTQRAASFTAAARLRQQEQEPAMNNPLDASIIAHSARLEAASIPAASFAGENSSDTNDATADLPVEPGIVSAPIHTNGATVSSATLSTPDTETARTPPPVAVDAGEDGGTGSNIPGMPVNAEFSLSSDDDPDAASAATFNGSPASALPADRGSAGGSSPSLPSAAQEDCFDLDELLGPPPLIRGESPKHYQALLRRVRSAIKPTDVTEEFAVRDVVYSSWEAARFGRFKAKFMDKSAGEVVVRILGGDRTYDDKKDLEQRWASSDGDDQAAIDRALAAQGLDREAVMAEAVVQRLNAIERLDGLIASADKRREAALRSLDRRREFASRLRAAADAIRDAEFDDVTDIVNEAAP